MEKKILEVATQAIAEQGTDFTMDYLAATLNISKRTLYQYFDSKEKLVETIVVSQIEDWSRRRTEVLAEDLNLEDKLRKYFQIHPDLFSLMLPSRIVALFRFYPSLEEKAHHIIETSWQCLEEFLVVQQKQGLIRDIPVAAGILMIRAAAEKIFDDCPMDSEQEYVEQYLRAIVEIAIGGLLVKEEETK